MSDLDTIKKLESQMGRQFRTLDNPKDHQAGYILDQDNNVVVLSLRETRLSRREKIDYSSLIPLIGSFVHLTKLTVDSIAIKDLSLLSGLRELKSLSLLGRGIIDFSPLKELKNLEALKLTRCEIEHIEPLISCLKDLPNLRSLELSRNKISDIFSISTLEKLTYLNLLYNQIEDATSISKLPSLVTANLGHNQISNISAFRDMKHLNVLWLIGNLIKATTHLEGLTNLIRLSLANNDLESIYPLKNLKRLENLHLQQNHISDIYPLIELKQLRVLYLDNNNISDITPLKSLNNLSKLHLQKNPISELPKWITDFDAEIEWKKYGGIQEKCIMLYENPLKSPPPEIVAQGKRAIINYYEQLEEQNIDYLFEAKMLIVGEPGAGKTTLVRKLENPFCDMPKEEDTTRGIDVNPYYFPLLREDFPEFNHPEKLANRNFCLNLWDFGGQQIYKATHRFFLSERSLYALVADSRNENTDFNYWLHVIEMFGGESPLLIILNEKHNRKRSLDVLAMRNRFSNISEVIEVDFSEEDKTRIYKLQKALKYYVSKLTHVGSPVPAKWTVIRQKLENDTHNTISLQEYIEICQKTELRNQKTH
jgi:internalin A